MSWTSYYLKLDKRQLRRPRQLRPVRDPATSPTFTTSSYTYIYIILFPVQVDYVYHDNKKPRVVQIVWH